MIVARIELLRDDLKKYRMLSNLIKVEIDDETRKELEKAPQVNERPGPLDLPQLAPEKLIPIHLTTDLSDDALNETKSEPKSKVWLL